MPHGPADAHFLHRVGQALATYGGVADELYRFTAKPGRELNQPRGGAFAEWSPQGGDIDHCQAWPEQGCPGGRVDPALCCRQGDSVPHLDVAVGHHRLTHPGGVAFARIGRFCRRPAIPPNHTSHGWQADQNSQCHQAQDRATCLGRGYQGNHTLACSGKGGETGLAGFCIFAHPW